MSVIGYGRVLGALLLAGSVAIACGGVNKGQVNIVGGDGGSDGNGEGGSGGNGANSGNGGSSAAGGSDAQAGEGGDGPVPVLPEPPVVVSVSPENGESQAEPTGSIRIEFSEGLDPSTVTSDSILIYDGETPIAGELEYSGVTAEFTPAQRLHLLAEYSIVVTTEITDAGGTAMTEDFSSAFTVRDGAWREELLVQNADGALHRTLVAPVIDGNGNALIVWGQDNAGETVTSVFGRTYSPEEGFGEPFEIDQTDVTCDHISVATNAAGESIVAWTESRGGGEEVWVRRLSGGELAASAERVDAVAVAVGGTVSAVSATGEAHVLWWFNDTAGATKQNILANHAAPDEAWLSTPTNIYQYADTLSPPAVAFDEDGNGFVFFALDYNSDALEAQLYARRYLQTSGEWGNGVTIDGSDGVRLYEPPSAVSDAEGGARAVFSAGQDVKVVGFSKASGFGTAETIDQLDSNPASLPQISSNGSRFLASWYQSASLTTNAYSSLSDGGDFSAPELRSSGDFQVGYYGTAVSGLDAHGNALLLFEQGNAVGTVDIVFGRLAASSGEWADGALVNSLEGEYQDPRVAVAPNGVAIAAWSVGIRLSAESIYVTTFD
jgi:hypothetical protein